MLRTRVGFDYASSLAQPRLGIQVGSQTYIIAASCDRDESAPARLFGERDLVTMNTFRNFFDLFE